MLEKSVIFCFIIAMVLIISRCYRELLNGLPGDSAASRNRKLSPQNARIQHDS
jgi:hypothetical protein